MLNFGASKPRVKGGGPGGTAPDQAKSQIVSRNGSVKNCFDPKE